MNLNPDVASMWKGRIMMEIICEATDKPVAKIKEIDAIEVKNSRSYCMAKNDYTVAIEVGQGVALPKDKAYNLSFCIGGAIINTGNAINKIKTNYNLYNFGEIKTFQLQYQDLSDMGRIIMTLNDGKSPICFHSEAITNYEEPNAEYKWINLKPDLAVGSVKDTNKAGIFSMKLSIFKGKLEPKDVRQFGMWKKPKP